MGGVHAAISIVPFLSGIQRFSTIEVMDVISCSQRQERDDLKILLPYRGLMMKIFRRAVVFIFLVCFSLIATAQEHDDAVQLLADDGIILRYFLGHGGAIRQNTDFYPEEIIFLSLELPSKFAVDNRYDFDSKCFLVFDPDSLIPRNDVVTTRYSGHLTKNQSSFTVFVGYRIPKNIKAGKYEFRIELYDRLNDRKFAKKDIVEILDASKFGMRGLMLWRGILGTQQFGLGSGYFAAGEWTGISFTVGGLTVDNESRVRASVEIRLIDENDQSVDIPLDEAYLRDPRSIAGLNEFVHSGKDIFGNDIVRTWDLRYTIPLTQPGHYRMSVAIHDLNSGEVSGYILPIFVNSSVPAQPIVSVVEEDTQ